VRKVRFFQLELGAWQPDWFIAAMNLGRVKPADPEPKPDRWAIQGMLVSTPTGEKHARTGDWVLCDERNRLYVTTTESFEFNFNPPPLKGRRADLLVIDDLLTIDDP
jgi:hypothetical protein